MGTVIDEFVTKHLQFLKLEKDAEFEEQAQWLQTFSLSTLQRKGICIPNIKIGSYHTGMFGRCIIIFEAKNAAQLLPSHTLTVGDLAGVWSTGIDSNRKIVSSGVVTRVTSTNIRIAFEDSFENLELDETYIYQLVKITSEITFKRIKKCLENLAKDQHGERSHLINVLFGKSAPSSINTGIDDACIDNGLNQVQREAVKMALEQKEVAIIHGPPGTGKTTTVAEIILQLLKSKLKILICAPSNVAVDNILERLAQKRLNLIRLGHPARTLPSIQKFLLDSVLSRSENSQVLNELKKEIDDLTSKMQKCHIKKEYYHYKFERQLLFKDLRQREKNELSLVLKKADAILCTLTGASGDGPLKHLPADYFDVVVIDECSQAVEAACWIPLMRASKCILAGDHMQLPPTIFSKKAAEDGFSISLMERLIKMFDEANQNENQCVKLLEIQYRMHKDIMTWPSSQLYQNKLIAHESVATHLLKDIDEVESNDITSIPLLWIDTAGCDLAELELEEEDSKGNEGEADLVAVHVEALIKSGIKYEDIAVIAPYNLQVELIRLRLLHKYPALEIKSVDGFQGREKEAVVLSLVRSNPKGEVGFLADNRRINVAVTRAKRHLAIIGDSETVSHDAFLKLLVEFVNANGEVWTANQFSREIENVESASSERVSCKAKVAKPKVKTVVESIKGTKNVKITISSNTAIKPIVSDEEKARIEFQKRFQFEHIISEFIADKERDAYKFPSSLSSFDRMIIHELAEKYDLFHISEGEADSRYITLFKNQIVVSLKNLKLSNGNNHSDTIESTQVSRTTTLNQSSISNPTIQPENTRNEKKKPEGKKKDSQKVKSVARKKVQDDEFDSILDAAIAMKDTCKCKGCKESVKLFGQICNFCKEKYCLAHCVPETHGCTENIREHSRKTATKDYKQMLQNGSDKKIKTIDPVKRIHLQRKLDKKLSELNSQRKGKK